MTGVKEVKIKSLKPRTLVTEVIPALDITIRISFYVDALVKRM